jgi:hypothetical protein
MIVGHHLLKKMKLHMDFKEEKSTWFEDEVPFHQLFQIFSSHDQDYECSFNLRLRLNAIISISAIK